MTTKYRAIFKKNFKVVDDLINGEYDETVVGMQKVVTLIFFSTKKISFDEVQILSKNREVYWRKNTKNLEVVPNKYFKISFVQESNMRDFFNDCD